MTVDSVVQAVIDKHVERAIKGKAKYNTDLDRGDLSLSEWLTHLQEELMDASCYAEKAKREGYSEMVKIMLTLMSLTIPPKHVEAFEDWLNTPMQEHSPFKGGTIMQALKNGEFDKVKYGVIDVTYM